MRLAMQSRSYGLRLRQSVLTSSCLAPLTFALLTAAAWDYQKSPANRHLTSALVTCVVLLLLHKPPGAKP